jgi:DNA-directed RNA polymerase subunit K/omega
MIELPEGFDSVFRYIVVVSQRAEQLINGAKPRTDSRYTKPTLEAREDVDAGLVDWRVLSQAELDAQRQAIVDQFRAEVAGEELLPESARLIPDVLPTSSAALADDESEDEDRDDELARLQRLLGMVGDDSGDGEDVELIAEEADDLSEDSDDDLLDLDDDEDSDDD